MREDKTIPSNEEILSKLRGAKYYSKFDAASGSSQISENGEGSKLHHANTFWTMLIEKLSTWDLLNSKNFQQKTEKYTIMKKHSLMISKKNYKEECKNVWKEPEAQNENLIRRNKTLPEWNNVLHLKSHLSGPFQSAYRPYHGTAVQRRPS